MSKRSNRGTDSRRSRKPKRPLLATAAAIGGAGLILATPGAALMAAPGKRRPRRWSRRRCKQGDLDFFGTGGLSAAPFDPIFELFGAIPFVKIFIGNGADGTAANPNGGNAGLFAGNGGDGFSPTVPGTPGVTAAPPGCSSATAAKAATAPPASTASTP